MQVRESIVDTLRAAVAASEHLLTQSAQSVDQLALIGADILLDQKGQAWLIEFTKGPAFRFSPQHMSDLHSGMCSELVEALLEMQDCRQAGVSFHDNGQSLLGSMKNFEQIWPLQSNQSMSLSRPESDSELG